MDEWPDDVRAKRTPLSVRVSHRIEDAIIEGVLEEDARTPSVNDLAAAFGINAATAAKGLRRLADRGVVYKRRGVGTFVSAGAKQQLLDERRAALVERFVDPLIAEARKLDLSATDLAALLGSRAALFLK